jgi:hypothetical protein
MNFAIHLKFNHLIAQVITTNYWIYQLYFLRALNPLIHFLPGYSVTKASTTLRRAKRLLQRTGSHTVQARTRPRSTEKLENRIQLASAPASLAQLAIEKLARPTRIQPIGPGTGGEAWVPLRRRGGAPRSPRRRRGARQWCRGSP